MLKIDNPEAISRFGTWGRAVSVTIPIHTGYDLGRGLAVRILKDAGFSVEDFLRLR